MPQDRDDLESQTDLEGDVSTESETDNIVHSNGTGSRLAAIEQNQQMLALMNDPDIHAVIQARRAGKQVKVVEAVEETTTEPEPEDLTTGLEDTDPVKPTLQKIGSHIDKRVSARDAEIDQLKAKVAELSQIADVVRERDVTDQITKVSSKFKDFKDFRDPMIKLSGQYPGLSVEDLYVLAKSRSGKLKLVEQGTFTERPTAQPQRSSATARRNPAAPSPAPGKKGFEEILARAFKNTDIIGEE